MKAALLGPVAHLLMINLIILGALPLYLWTVEWLATTPWTVAMFVCLPIGAALAVARALIRRHSRLEP